ncbi:MAG: MBL fold metallo-hydrolase [Pseudomonadota bacterium]
MRFATLGSGSQGNAHLIETPNVRVLIDCGFPAREIERRLSLLGVEADSLDAILLTHEHTDHIRGLGPVARRYHLPAWMTSGTYSGANSGRLPEVHRIDSHAGEFFIGDLEVLPYPVPHDSREPCQFIFHCAGQHLGILTDAGHITPHIVENLADCDSLILEFNHDTGMLVSGPYPPSLQRRVGGSQGHLNNQQSVDLLSQLDLSRLQHLVAAHLSEKNNTRESVRQTLFQAHHQLEGRLSFADQQNTAGWYAITSP